MAIQTNVQSFDDLLEILKGLNKFAFKVFCTDQLSNGGIYIRSKWAEHNLEPSDETDNALCEELRFWLMENDSDLCAAVFAAANAAKNEAEVRDHFSQDVAPLALEQSFEAHIEQNETGSQFDDNYTVYRSEY